MAWSGTRGNRIFLLALLVASSVLSGALMPARAHHGSWHTHPHVVESGSCCLEAWAHTGADRAKYLQADIYKNGYWFAGVCGVYNDYSCVKAFSPHKLFNTPVTIRGRFFGDSNPHFLDAERSIYYP